MTAARPASEATASAPASGTTACPLTVTVLPGMGAGAAVTTRAHPWWADSSTSRAPAAATPRTSAYSRTVRAAAGGRCPAAAVQRLIVHPAQHQHLAGVVLLGDGRDEPGGVALEPRGDLGVEPGGPPCLAHRGFHPVLMTRSYGRRRPWPPADR